MDHILKLITSSFKNWTAPSYSTNEKKLYSPLNFLEAHGFQDINNSPWRISYDNANYNIIPDGPGEFIIWNQISSETLPALAKSRESGYFPTLSWSSNIKESPFYHTSIFRCRRPIMKTHPSTKVVHLPASDEDYLNNLAYHLNNNSSVFFFIYSLN